MKSFLTGVALAFLLIGCETTPYYKTMEVLGVEKRELLVDRLDDTRASMVEAQALMRGAVTGFRTAADAPPENIEGAYKSFKDDYEDMRNKIRDMEGDIDAVKRVADDMFADWEKELALYQDPALKAESEAKLAETRARFTALERTIDEVEQKLDPIVFTVRDRVLYLSRNQTSETLARMKADAPALTEEVRGGTAEIDRAIAAVQDFTSFMRGG